MAIGELSAIPGHKSTCTYRIASESLLYIPCSPRNGATSSSHPRAVRAGIPLTRYGHELPHAPGRFA